VQFGTRKPKKNLIRNACIGSDSTKGAQPIIGKMGANPS